MLADAAQPADADHEDPTDAAATDALAELRRIHLIRSWDTDDGSFHVVVGRGTVAVAALDAAGVLHLAQTLRRDKVTVVGRGFPMGHRTTRYHLSDGRFLDRYDSRVERYLDDHPYTVYVPGGDPSGCAAVDFAARTQKEALALAGLARVRGQCTRCQCLRPLHIDGWQPDPTIPCPSCHAGPRVPVVLLCRTCQQPICGTVSSGLWRSAWHHVATRNSYCAIRDASDLARDRPQARPV